MGNYAIIEHDLITNIIVADVDFASQIGAICCDGIPICIGDGFESGRFKRVIIKYDIDGQPTGEDTVYYDPSVPAELQQQYDDLSVQYIHDRYTYDEENKIIREYLSDQTNEQYKAAFDSYNAYVLECKQRAHTQIYGDSTQ